MSTPEPIWVAPQGAIVVHATIGRPQGGWGELSVSVLGDLRARPHEISAGTFQIPADALGEVTRQAVATWLRTAAAADWLRIYDFMVQGRGGVIVLEWQDGDESFHTFLSLMGFGE